MKMSKTRLSEDSSFEEEMDRVFVGTIHSFCLIIQSRGNLIGLDANMVLFEMKMIGKLFLKTFF